MTSPVTVDARRRPSLLERLGLRAYDAGAESVQDRVLLARAFVWLTCAGSALSLVALAIQGGWGPRQLTVLASVLVGMALAGIALVVFERLPLAVYQGFTLVGVGSITLGVAAVDGLSLAFVLFYVWIAVGAAYFFSRGALAVQLVAVAVAYGVLLLVADAGYPELVSWLLTVVTSSAVAILVVTMKARLVRLRAQERRELEQLRELEVLREELRQSQKLEAIGTLAGGVAHDFNNLLTGILGYAQLAEVHVPEDAELRRDLAEIRRAAEQAAGLTRQLLAFGRRQVLAARVVDMNRLVRETTGMLRRIVDERIELAVEPARGVLAVRADPVQLQQVLLNLVVNARDATSSGGRVVVATRDCGEAVELSVSDTGSGMDEQVRARAFEPYFTTKREGTGLGLSSVYGIVRQTGGTIELDSQPGRGTTVTVSLSRVDAAPDGDLPAPAVGLAATETVLLVEDEEMVRRIACKILADHGYRVLEAQHGRQALLIAGSVEQPIDVVLTDVVMPEMSGPELIEALAPSRPELGVVFMSGYPGDSIGELGVAAPAAFIAKPFTPDALLATVAGVLGARRAA